MRNRIRLIGVINQMVGKQQTIYQIDLPDEPQTTIPFPDLLFLESDETNYMLYAADGQFDGDTWQQPLEETADQAELEYGEALGAWLVVPTIETRRTWGRNQLREDPT